MCVRAMHAHCHALIKLKHFGCKFTKYQRAFHDIVYAISNPNAVDSSIFYRSIILSLRIEFPPPPSSSIPFCFSFIAILFNHSLSLLRSHPPISLSLSHLHLILFIIHLPILMKFGLPNLTTSNDYFFQFFLFQKKCTKIIAFDYQ